jgi:hypothetical protein
MNENTIFVILNLLANFINFVTSLIFIYFLFGRAKSVVNNFPLVSHWVIKVGLSIFCAGSLFCFLKELEDTTKSIAVWQQLLRNIGIAMVFSWAVIFHWRYFIKEKKAKAKSKLKNSPKKKSKPKIKK